MLDANKNPDQVPDWMHLLIHSTFWQANMLDVFFVHHIKALQKPQDGIWPSCYHIINGQLWPWTLSGTENFKLMEIRTGYNLQKI